VIVPEVGAVPVLLTASVYVPVEPAVKLPVCVFEIARIELTIVVGSFATGVFAAPPPLAVALFVRLAGALGATLTTRAIGLPAAPAAIAVVLVHVTIAPAAAHAHPVPLPALYVRPVGNVSVTVTVPVVAALPVLLTVIVYVPVPPATNEPVCDFAIASTGEPVSVVGSCAVGVFDAPPPLAATAFVTEPGDPPTLTVREIEFPTAPAAMLVALVHVTVWPAAPHVQPVPLAEANVRPAGSVSIAAIVPEVATLPVLPTAIVYVPVAPIVKFPVCVFVTESAGAPEIVVGSFATGAFAAPPPLAVAVFVSEPGAVVEGTVTFSVIDGKAPAAATAAVVVHVTTCNAAAHVQPVPVADANVRPTGSVSTTVVVPKVVAPPVFVTAIVYAPVPPTGKLPTCVFEIASCG
jgi:hypothetical protein